jgi:DNA-binding CsgD family transcriptional regulator
MRPTQLREAAGLGLPTREALALVAGIDGAHDMRARFEACLRAGQVAQRLGLAGEIVTVCRHAALVHDIGETMLDVLRRAGPLSDADLAVLREHPTAGARLIRDLEQSRHIARVVAHHLERMDGEGYPDGLRDDAIPLESRVVAVAERYAALVAHPGDGGPRTPPEAFDELRREAGSRFDARCVTALEHALAADGLLPQGGGPRAAAGDATGLTPRQTEVLGLLADGLGAREIAARLVISLATARNHIRARPGRPRRALAACRRGRGPPPRRPPRRLINACHLLPYDTAMSCRARRTVRHCISTRSVSRSECVACSLEGGGVG